MTKRWYFGNTYEDREGPVDRDSLIKLAYCNALVPNHFVWDQKSNKPIFAGELSWLEFPLATTDDAVPTPLFSDDQKAHWKICMASLQNAVGGAFITSTIILSITACLCALATIFLLSDRCYNLGFFGWVAVIFTFGLIFVHTWRFFLHYRTAQETTNPKSKDLALIVEKLTGETLFLSVTPILLFFSFLFIIINFSVIYYESFDFVGQSLPTN